MVVLVSILEHEVDGVLGGHADGEVGEVLIVSLIIPDVEVVGREDVRGDAIVNHEISLGHLVNRVSNNADGGSKASLDIAGGLEALVIVQVGDDGA